MLRDYKSLRRDSSKSSLVDEIENVQDSGDPVVVQSGLDVSRPPLNTIQEPSYNPKSDFDSDGIVGGWTKVDKTPTKGKGNICDTTLPHRTPDKNVNGFSARNRFGWGQKSEYCSVNGELHDEVRVELKDQLVQSSRGIGNVNGGFPIVTPRSARTVGRANLCYSESNSTQNTPTKSVNKPPNPGLRSKTDGNGGGRVGNFAAHYKGMPLTCGPPAVVNTVEVPHFDLKENSSFWMEHNVQVLIRIRPLNSMEKSIHGFNRCLKQETAQTISWVGQPETRFTFDNVACETVDQEMLFRMAGLPMVENCLSGYNSCMFAYGQTGSGKTYTMLGEIDNLEVRPSSNRGMTPRIFEFLFARIRAEEEIRRDERLQYNCKCSFLEIYNEQITDLLDSSSSNLLVREDMKKGVYVENLSEFEVQTVGDILKLLLQGSLNRKVAATNMNKESSRSHSVFTCVIESRWEKDSTSNLRFARLNLVDLAGSERQKSSGAEGERLKEAANINKSLSTLGHVIMVLLDVAHGKPKHVPYRDSRLTFLLQDSLGGNSKTMIIANISPSIGCASETLNTLKFAQRAKLIQNNAVVNEDSSGDVATLQHQICILKEELSSLKRQNVSRSLSFGQSIVEDTSLLLEDCKNDESKSRGIVRMSSKQFKSLETTLAGALRREQMAETSIMQLEAEIEQLKRLVRQREEDSRCTKMTLRFREDKINRMESLLAASIPADSYLVQENTALSKENELLQAKVDRNPEVTRFASENIKLLEQLRRYQDFYEDGEREILMTEVSQLRDQLLQSLDANSKQHSHQSFKIVSQEVAQITNEHDSLQFELEHTLNELGECRSKLSSCLEANAELTREMNDLRSRMNNLTSPPIEQKENFNDVKDSLWESPAFVSQLPKAVHNKVEEQHKSVMNQVDEIVNLQLELDILKLIVKEEQSSRKKGEEKFMSLNRDLDQANEKIILMGEECGNVKNELKDAKSVIEALESQQILLINEMEDLKNINNKNGELLCKKELDLRLLKGQLSSQELRDHSPIQTKLKRMQDSLETAKKLNMWYQTDRAFQTSNEEEMDEVCRQAEAETAEVIVCLQEELSILQQQVHDSNLKETETTKQVIFLQTQLKELEEQMCLLIQKLEDKDLELTTLSDGWELLTGEIVELLAKGHEEILDASDQLDLISNSFPKQRSWVSGQVGKMIRIISEKELLIEELRRCLDDANKRGAEVECRVRSLRGAALAITEAHQQNVSKQNREIPLLEAQLSTGKSLIKNLENKIMHGEDQLRKASVCATVAFVIVNRLHETNLNNSNALKHKNILLSESTEKNLQKDACLRDQAIVIEEAEKHIQLLFKELRVSEESCCSLRLMLAQEQERTCAMKHKIEDIEEDELLNTRQMLADLKAGVLTLRSSIKMPLEQLGSPKKVNTEVTCSLRDVNCDERTHTNLKDEVGRSVIGTSHDTKSVSKKTSKDTFDRESTIILHKKEIESAFETLKMVEAEMAKLRDEKQEIWLSEKQSRQSMRNTMAQLFELQTAMVNFEEESELKMAGFSKKLLAVEQTVYEACASWYQTNEKMELEVGQAIINASQKVAEASCFLEKFTEAQDIMKEADISINKLLIANERMKTKVEELKKEKDVLIEEVQGLQFVNSMQDQQYANLEKLFNSNLIDNADLVSELEDIVAQVQSTSLAEFKSIAHDIQCMKLEFVDITKSMRFGLEDIFSEIIVKDCAVSVLHLCHTGILLETVTGLNAENGFLHHGLCESNSVIDDLRKHNVKSRRELEMCRILKGKLLADIKNSFDRISRKEQETVELTIKLNTFEKRVLDLQLQEELMLQRSSNMGSELNILMKELETSNTNALASLIEHEMLLNEKEEDIESEAELLMTDLLSKDFQSLILKSWLMELATHTANVEMKQINCFTAVDNMVKELILVKIDTGLKELLLEDYQVEVSHLQKNDEVIKALEHDVQQRNTLNEKLQEEHTIKESALELSYGHVANLESQTQGLEEKICLLESSLSKLQRELDAKVIELGNMGNLEKENMSLKNEMRKLESQLLELATHTANVTMKQINCFTAVDNMVKELILVKIDTGLKELLLEDNQVDVSRLPKKDEIIKALNHDDQQCNPLNDERLQQEYTTKESALELSYRHVANLESQTQMLEKKICLLESSLSELQKELDAKVTELGNMDSLEKENMILKTETRRLETENSVAFQDLEQKKSGYESSLHRINVIDAENGRLKDKIDSLETCITNLQSDINLKNAELLRKDDMVKGLLFDLSLLQESASNIKDQKDEIREMMVSLEALETELQVKSNALDEAVSFSQGLETQLKGKICTIFTLESEISQLTAKVNAIDGLENELVEMGTALHETKASIDTMKQSMNELTCERDQLQIELLHLKGKLDMAEADAEGHEAIAVEAQQIAESSKVYAEEKEEEVKLLERSVEELESTVDVLENKVDIVKGEAERQRLQREELELELHAIRCQLQNVKSGDGDIKRLLDQKKTELHKALKQVQIVEMDLANRDAEISKFKAHISELNLHAEAQACEYKQKFKALQGMVEQVKLEDSSTHVTNSSSNKLEKNASKSKGSGSPFKCIGLGLVHQMKSEKDEELTAAKIRIEELEALAVSRQKEVFMLNAKLASADSMTHDVIRELLGVKLDVTNYAFLLDKEQVQKLTETPQFHSIEYHVKEEEVLKLKRQLNEFIEERAGWIEEIDRKQAELVAVQLALEKLGQQDQFLKAENETLKMENVENKKRVMDLEGEMKKLAGQQNLQQRIHHHAKIKEENNQLRIQNDNLTTKLQKTDGILSRVKEELACYRSSIGRNSCINFDEEQRLSNKLKETEEERLQLAQKLLGLCTSILKVAGIRKHVADMSLPDAEEALELLKNRINSLECELEAVNWKNSTSKATNNLSDVMPRRSSRTLRADKDHQSLRRVSQSSYLSASDR